LTKHALLVVCPHREGSSLNPGGFAHCQSRKLEWEKEMEQEIALSASRFDKRQ